MGLIAYSYVENEIFFRPQDDLISDLVRQVVLHDCGNCESYSSNIPHIDCPMSTISKESQLVLIEYASHDSIDFMSQFGHQRKVSVVQNVQIRD